MSEYALTNDYIELSRYAGMRFDLVQASGGNTSVKLDNARMLVKASGVHLSEVDKKTGFVEVNYPNILRIIQSVERWRGVDKKVRDTEVIQSVLAETRCPSGKDRASIEVFMHAALGRFVLHTHPIAVNLITCRKDWDEILKDIFPEALCVEYSSPGIELGVKTNTRIKEFQAKFGLLPNLVFLQNHGLLISSDLKKDVQELTEEVIQKCENFCGIGLERYRNTTALAKYLGADSVPWLSEDVQLVSLLSKTEQLAIQRPLYPDSLVFCGVTPLVLDDFSSHHVLEAYKTKNKALPKVVLYRGHCYFIDKNIRKAKDIEEVYKAHALILANLGQPPNYLSEEETAYLGNWEAEKFRKER